MRQVRIYLVRNISTLPVEHTGYSPFVQKGISAIVLSRLGLGRLVSDYPLVCRFWDLISRFGLGAVDSRTRLDTVVLRFGLYYTPRL